MSRRRVPTLTIPVITGLLAATGATMALAAPAHAEAGTTIYVSPEGSDSWTSDAGAPQKSIARAIRLAQPGDRIVVRGGTYTEAAGWGATPGTKDAPITLTAAKGERVVLKGTLQLDGADYWTVNGINVTSNGDRKEFLVKFDGGTGWRFQNAEVWGTKGVSNIMVSASEKNGTPSEYRITGNCVHDNNATGDAFMNDHQIYLMPGYSAGSGLVSRNIFFNTENGAAVKAAGPTSATGASNVTIANNTIVRSAAGVVIGFRTNHVAVRKNLIGAQVKRVPSGAQWAANYRAAVVGNHVTGGGNLVSSNGVWGFPDTLYLTKDSTSRISHANLLRATPAFNSSSSCDGFKPRNSVARAFGRYS